MRSITTCAAIFIAALSSAAMADTVAFQSNNALSTENLGSFAGTLGWTYLGGSSGQLTVQITNTSLPANGGYLTAFMFRASTTDSLLSSSLITTSDSDFLNIPAGESAPPFPGTWNGGAGLGGDFLGGGSPVPGLGVGASGTFVFAINSTFASSLSASSFLAGEYDFVVRFRGFNNGGSDKTPGQLVPAPGAIALLGVAGVLGRRRRRG